LGEVTGDVVSEREQLGDQAFTQPGAVRVRVVESRVLG
jgi:hypothetical protein